MSQNTQKNESELTKVIIQHKGTVVERGKFKHVMALSLDSRTQYKEGLIRCITSRTGNVGIRGNVDKSQLYKVRGAGLEHFVISERLKIDNEEEVVRSLGKDFDFLGLEDPDVWFDEKTRITHVYFTIPLRDNKRKETRVYLGHAEGPGLDSLRMTQPLLSPTKDNFRGAKELSIAPINKQGVRLNLIESADIIGKKYYSVVMVAVAKEPGKNWQYGDLEFHPKNRGYDWCSGHASPGPLLPRAFIDVGENKLLGILNGREADIQKGDETIYGIFSPGLMIYNYEHGKVEWISEKPLIRDSQAQTITFASQFIQTDSETGILYAHVDDSFVRAYTLNSSALRTLIP